MKRRGLFLVVDITGSKKPEEVTGELREALPRGFKKSIEIALHRLGRPGPRTWGAVHFPTGMLLSSGLTADAAFEGAVRNMSTMKAHGAFVPPEELFARLVSRHPVINTELKSPYQAKAHDDKK
jgi:hypothetical protein